MSMSLLMTRWIPSVSAVMVLSLTFWAISFFDRIHRRQHMPPQTMLAWVSTGFRRIMPTIATDKVSGSCNHEIFLCSANLQNCSLLLHVFSVSTRGALQIQDRSPQWSRQNASAIGCATQPVLIVATSLGFATRPSWGHSLVSTDGLILIGNYLCLHHTNWTQ